MKVLVFVIAALLLMTELAELFNIIVLTKFEHNVKFAMFIILLILMLIFLKKGNNTLVNKLIGRGKN
jgi:hypothetical protein